jgi:hypothetical protein
VIKRSQIGVKVFFSLVMDRSGMMLTAFLMQPQPPSFALLVVIAGVHGDNGRDAGKL